MNSARTNPPGLENASAPAGEIRFAEPMLPQIKWSWSKIFFLVILTVVIHVTLICFFGTKKQIVPRRVENVPHLQLANDQDQFIALANPTLFALPNPRDFSSAIWLKVPFVTTPSFRWTNSPQWLALDAGNPGAVFQQLQQAAPALQIQLKVKPPAVFPALDVSTGTAMPQTSTLNILGGLAMRLQDNGVSLPSLAYNGVIPPSKIQVLVDTTGTVVSAILLPLIDTTEAADRWDPADQRALEIARRLRFAPAGQMTFGDIIFRWHTVPVPLNQTQTNP